MLAGEPSHSAARAAASWSSAALPRAVKVTTPETGFSAGEVLMVHLASWSPKSGPRLGAINGSGRSSLVQGWRTASSTPTP